MKKKTLNPTQLLHMTNPCAGKKCALPDCTICLCDKRSDAEFCCDEDKAKKNNMDLASEDFQVNYRKKENKKNTIIIEDVYDRGYRQMDIPALKLLGFNFEVAPIAGIILGRKVALYGTIAMWIDPDKIIHLEKI
ncbi:MAG: hypothetical protein V4580_11335 [Bacteroidota bacterium]